MSRGDHVISRARGVWPGLALTLVLLLALTLRLALVFRAPLFLTGDSEGYLVPAFALAHGQDLDLSIKRTPAYPAFVALSLILQGDDLQSLALLQHLVGLLTVAAVFWLGRSLGGTVVGSLAALVSAVSGTQLMAEHSLMTEALFVPVLTSALALATLMTRSESHRAAACAGAVLGLAILVRPVALVLAPLIAVAPVVQLGLQRRAVAAGVISLAVTGLVFSAWTLRPGKPDEAAVGGLGQTLIGRTARHDRGGFTYWDPARYSAEPEQRQQVRRILQDAVDRGSSGRAVHTRIRKELDISPAEADALMRDLALETIRDQFDYYLQGTAQRFVRLAQPVPERLRDARNTNDVARQRWEDEPTRPLLAQVTTSYDREADAAEWVTSLQLGRLGPLVPLLAVFGAVVLALRGQRGLAFLLADSAISLLLSSAALVGNVPRYRYPVDPLMVALGIAGVCGAAGALRQLPRTSERASPPMQPSAAEASQ